MSNIDCEKIGYYDRVEQNQDKDQVFFANRFNDGLNLEVEARQYKVNCSSLITDVYGIVEFVKNLNSKNSRGFTTIICLNFDGVLDQRWVLCQNGEWIQTNL